MRQPDLESLLGAVEAVYDEDARSVPLSLIRDIIVAQAENPDAEHIALERVRELVEQAMVAEGS